MNEEWEQRSGGRSARRLVLPLLLVLGGVVAGLGGVSKGPDPSLSIDVEESSEAPAPAPAPTTAPAANLPAGGTWSVANGGPLSARSAAAVAGGGRWVLVWGGIRPGGPNLLASGALYDAVRNDWVRIPRAPIAPRLHAAITWTGREFVAWGGLRNGREFADGAAFDPRSRRWRRLAPAPLTPRFGAHAVAAGDEVLVWGGRSGRSRFDIDDGAAYDLRTNRWRVLPDGPLEGRQDDDVSAVALDGGMFVWSSSSSSAVTAFYDGGTRRWRNLGPPRFLPGSRPVFVPIAGAVLGWGTSAGAQPLPVALMFTTGPDWWATLARPPVADPRSGAVVAGNGTVTLARRGVYFDILTGRWGAMAAAGQDAPQEGSANAAASAVWAGDRLVVWRGDTGPGHRARTRAWRPTMPWQRVKQAPISLTGDVSALWTGWLADQQQALVFNDIGAPPHNGAAYRPAAGTWEALTKPPVSPRTDPAVAWTGDELIVAGGRSASSGDLLRDAVAYDPLARAWRRLPRPPVAVSEHALASGADGLYLAGSRDGDALVYRFDTGTGRWLDVARPPLDGGDATFAVHWTGFEVWVWRVDEDGAGTGAAWDPRHRLWRNLPASPPWFDTGTAVTAGRRMFLVNAGGATQSLGWGGEGWLNHPRAPVTQSEAVAPSVVWTGRRLVTTVGKGADIASLDPRAGAWVRHPGPALGGTRNATLLYTGRQLFAFGTDRIAVLGDD